MENQDLDLIGQTVGSMPYKVGIIGKDGNLKNQFVVKASTNRIDIPESSLGTFEVPQLPSALNLFSGSAVGNIVLPGPTPNYNNVQDGLLITLGNKTIEGKATNGNGPKRMDLSSIGLNSIKIPKEKLVVNSSFDISDKLSQYIGKTVTGQYYDGRDEIWESDSIGDDYSIIDFGGTTINVLPNTTLSVNLTVSVQSPPKYYNESYNALPIPVIQVNTYKN